MDGAAGQRWWPDRALRIGVVGVLALLGMTYHLGGYYWLVLGPQGAWDLRLRWMEQQAVFAGVSPFDVFVDFHAGRPIPDSLRQYGPYLMVDYPPWSYFSGLILFWPPWAWTRVLFAGLNLAATMALVTAALRLAGRRDGGAGWVIGAGLLAISSSYNTLVAGNYGLVVVGLLTATWWLVDRGQDVAGGILLGVAMLKPTLAGPFLLPFLVCRRVRVLLGCGGYLLVASVVVWWLTRTDPVTMVVQMVRFGEGYIREAYGPLNFLLLAGMESWYALPLVGVAGLAVGVAAMAARPRASLAYQYGAASLAARLWTYHKVLDDVVLAFLLLAVGLVWLTERTRGSAFVFAILGLSLWLPGRLVAYPDRVPLTIWVQLFHVLAWVAGGVYLVWAWRDRATSPMGRGMA